MSPRKNSELKVPSLAETRWIPANGAKTRSLFPKLYFRNISVPAEQKAVLSHWAQTLGTPFAAPFETAALKILENGTSPNESLSETPPQILFPDLFEVPFPPPKKPKFTFIDLFAGIGGFRIAMQNLGGKCVFSSEWDSQAAKTYEINYGEIPFGDITKEETKQFIPDNFDLLCAGFPCQAFSLAGKRRGFEETRGTLFFDVAEILRRKRPKAFFLENVKGLVCHDKGKTLKVILNTLRNLGYNVPEPKTLNAIDYGVPQHRERIYIVGFRNDLGISEFEYPKPNGGGA